MWRVSALVMRDLVVFRDCPGQRDYQDGGEILATLEKKEDMVSEGFLV